MKVTYFVFGILLLQQLSACSPVIVAGTVAGAGATVAADRRSADKMLEDQVIEVQATDFIYSHEKIGKSAHVSVTSFNGTVLLTGEVSSEPDKAIVLDHINRMRGVNKVIDAIQVRNRLTLADDTNDTWISSKVKSNIIANKGLITRTKVVTSDATVYLMGLVTNKEAKQIVNIVNGVGGVDRVIPLFESLDGTLDTELAASSHITQPETKPVSQSTTTVNDEDNVTIQNYVIQPAIQLSNDN